MKPYAAAAAAVAVGGGDVLLIETRPKREIEWVKFVQAQSHGQRLAVFDKGRGRARTGRRRSAAKAEQHQATEIVDPDTGEITTA